jgi:uncharacterized protein
MFHVKPGCSRLTWNWPPAPANAAGGVHRAAVDHLLPAAPAFVDAVVGGGGLVQVPAPFAICPQAAPGLPLGTNERSSIDGTAVSAVRHFRRVPPDPRVLVPALVRATLVSPAGARVVTWLPRDAVRPLVPVLRLVVAGHAFLRRDFGRSRAPRLPVQ